MIKLLNLIIFGHVHKWEIITAEDRRSEGVYGNKTEYTLRTLQCQECGKIKYSSNKNHL